MNNDIHYLILGLALLFAIAGALRPERWAYGISILLVCIELFSRVSK